MQIPPPSVLATWPAPNYEHPSEVHGPAILILTVILLPLSILVVFLRVYTRLRISRSFGADDVFIILAMMSTITGAVVNHVAIDTLGWNRHTWDVPPDKLVTGLKYAMVLEIVWAVDVFLTRMSLLLFVRRFMCPWHGWQRTVTWTLMVISVLGVVVFSVVVITTCRPVSAYWTLSVLPQQCIDESAHLLAGGIINTVADLCVIILPIPMVLKLSIPTRQRVVLVALFGAAFVVVIAGGVRIYFTYRLNIDNDKIWDIYPLWIAATVEVYLGIIAASIPATRKFFNRYLPRILGSSSIESQFPDPPSYHSNERAAVQVSQEDIEKSVREGRGSLQPVVSTFSTWKQFARDIPSPTGMWKRAHPPTNLFMHKKLPAIPPPPTPPESTFAASTLRPGSPGTVIGEATQVRYTRTSTRKISLQSVRSSISSFNVTSPAELEKSWEEFGPIGRSLTHTRSLGAEREDSIDSVEEVSGERDPRFESWRTKLRRSVSS